jgi:SRSO17 transposase
MVSGLLMELDNHSCWTIAKAIGHRGPHRLQHLLSHAVWDDQQLADIASAWAVGHLDDGDARGRVSPVAGFALPLLRM